MLQMMRGGLYCVLLSACQGGLGRSILMENRNKQDGIRSWYQLVNQYERDDNRQKARKRHYNSVPSTL